MPILNDIMDHPFFGPKLRRNIEIGREEGERQIVLLQIARRFGPIPVTAKKTIEALPAPKLKRLAIRLLDARTRDELLGSRHGTWEK